MRVNRHDAPSSRWSASTLRRSMLYRRPFLSAILISCPEAPVVCAGNRLETSPSREPQIYLRNLSLRKGIFELKQSFAVLPMFSSTALCTARAPIRNCWDSAATA